jgi:probable rRNA maturation factor
MARKSSAEDRITVDVDVQIAPAYRTSLSSSRLRAVAEAVLHAEGTAGHVTLVVTDDQGVRELNRDFLGTDAPTDVLAFSAMEDDGPFVAAPETHAYLGDVIVSYPRAVEQSAELGHSVQQELDLLIVHGLLHILGYDHAEPEDKALMWARQEQVLYDLPA